MAGRKRSKRPSRIPKSLSDKDIVTTPKMGRRRVMSMVGASVVGAAAATGCAPTGGGYPANSGVTDADTGAYADLAGAGRGAGRGAGVTDAFLFMRK